MKKVLKELVKNKVPYEYINFKGIKGLEFIVVYQYPVDNLSDRAKRLSTICVITKGVNGYIVSYNYTLCLDDFEKKELFKSAKQIFNKIIQNNYITHDDLLNINEHGLGKIKKLG